LYKNIKKRKKRVLHLCFKVNPLYSNSLTFLLLHCFLAACLIWINNLCTYFASEDTGRQEQHTFQH